LRSYLKGHSRRRCVVALAAAVAVVFATLVASFAAAQAAADSVAHPFNVICHASSPGTQSQDQGSASPCIDCCSAGCLMLVAPPPPRAALCIIRTSGPAAVSFTGAVRLGRLPSRSHRSRAPPQNA
jgi:hypothetical protein